MKIQTNPTGTRSIEIEETHLQTIEKYQLLRDLIDSNGYVDEQVLDKLKLNIRSLLESQAGLDKDLLDLCLDVSTGRTVATTTSAPPHGPSKEHRLINGIQADGLSANDEEGVGTAGMG